MEEIHIFRIKITPQIALDDRATRKALLEATLSDIKKYISKNYFIQVIPSSVGLIYIQLRLLWRNNLKCQRQPIKSTLEKRK